MLTMSGGNRLRPMQLGWRPQHRCILALTPTMLLMVWTTGCSKAGPDRPPQPTIPGHSVLLLTLDTTRADRLGCYGYSSASTPNLDALAARGTLFERAYAQVPITLPSHCSMMTGRYPRDLGVRDNGRNALPGSVETLAEIFQGHGYRTGAFVSSFVLDSRFGLHQGFGVYDDDLGPLTLHQSTIQLQRHAGAVTDRALAWLGEQQASPFFCWIHYYDPHDPYEAPPEFAAGGVDPYDAEIAFMDAQLGRVLDWVQRTGQADRTLVIAVGDHGESLGEHDYTGHPMFLYENIIRVPWIMAHPQAVAAGRRVSQVVEIAGLFPTVIDLIGRPRPADLLSRSLAAALRGGDLDPKDAFAESNYAFEFYGWSQQRSLVRGPWKYVASAEPALFNVAADPPETQNLIDRETQRASDMAAELRRFYELLPQGRGESIALDADAERAFASLGYLTGGSSFVDEFLTPGLGEPARMLSVVGIIGEAQSLMRQDRFADAAAMLEPLIADHPTVVDLQAHLGACYVRLDRPEEAERVLKKALEINSRHQLSLHTLGDLYVQLGRAEEAIHAYTAAAAAPAPNPQLFTKLGDLLTQTGRTDQALAHYQNWLATYPDFAALHARLGVILSDRGDEAGIEHLERAMRLAPADAWTRRELIAAWMRRAGAAAQRQQHETVAGALERILQLDPDNQKAVEQLTSYYLAERRTGEAIRVLRIGAQSQAVARTMILLANLLATSQDDSVRDGDEAVTWANRALEASGESRPQDVAVLAAAYAEAGRFDQAVRTAEQALSAAEQAGDSDLAAVVRGQIHGYREGKPFRHPQF